MSETKPSTGANILGILGLVLYVQTGSLYLISGLVVPWPWQFILWLLWIAGIYPLVMVFRTRRPWTALVAVGAVAMWWVYVTVGETFFGWTA